MSDEVEQLDAQALKCDCRDKCWLMRRGMLTIRCQRCGVTWVRTPQGVRRLDMAEEFDRA